MGEGRPDYLALRVVDNLQGGEIIGDLPHLHQTKWGVRALQQGMPGSSTLGTFTILLPPPGTDEFRRNRQLFTQLDMTAGKLRIEGYLGGRVTGSPRFSGVVTGGRRPLDAPWVLTGVDTLWMLQQSQVLPGELIAIGSATGFSVAKGFYGTLESVWDDDFSGWNGATHPNSSDYNLGTNWSFTSSDPYTGQPALTSTANGADSSTTTTTTWGAQINATGQQFNQSIVSIQGTMDAGNGTSEAGIWLIADSNNNPQNGILVSCTLVPLTQGWYNANVQIFKRVAGTYTSLGSATVLPNVVTPFPFRLEAVLCVTPPVPTAQSVIAGQFSIRALLNGQDSNLAVVYLNTIGGIGVRMGQATSTARVFVNRIQFHSRTSSSLGSSWGTNRFGQGGTKTGPGVLPMPISGSGQTNLDIIGLCAAFDGVSVRKNPGAGYKADTIDYGGGVGVGGVASPGTDYSASIVLEEGINIVANGTEVATVPEMLGTDVRVNSLPGANTGGSITWSRIAAIGDPILTDTVADMGIPGMEMLVNHARQIQARKVNPLQAKQVRVVRDERWLSVNGGAGPRELDTVQVYIPTLNVQRQAAVIVGYDFVEGDPTMLVYLSQLPAQAAALHPAQRVWRQLDNLGTTYKQR